MGFQEEMANSTAKAERTQHKPLGCAGPLVLAIAGLQGMTQKWHSTPGGLLALEGWAAP